MVYSVVFLLDISFYRGKNVMYFLALIWKCCFSHTSSPTKGGVGPLVIHSTSAKWIDEKCRAHIFIVPRGCMIMAFFCGPMFCIRHFLKHIFWKAGTHKVIFCNIAVMREFILSGFKVGFSCQSMEGSARRCSCIDSGEGGLDVTTMLA